MLEACEGGVGGKFEFDELDWMVPCCSHNPGQRLRPHKLLEEPFFTATQAAADQRGAAGTGAVLPQLQLQPPAAAAEAGAGAAGGGGGGGGAAVGGSEGAGAAGAAVAAVSAGGGGAQQLLGGPEAGS